MISTYATNQIKTTWGKIALAHKLTPAKTLVVFPSHVDNEYMELELDIITTLKNGQETKQIVNVGNDIEANMSYLRVFKPWEETPIQYLKPRIKWPKIQKQTPNTSVASGSDTMSIAVSAKPYGEVHATVEETHTVTFYLIPHKKSEENLTKNSFISVIYDRVNDSLIINAPTWGVFCSYPLSDDIENNLVKHENTLHEVITFIDKTSSELNKKKLDEFITTHTTTIDTGFPQGRELKEFFDTTDVTFVTPIKNMPNNKVVQLN